MDWMRLPLRPARPRAISSAELASHCTKYDCWTALHGKVYNITQYMDYHPGGGSILMKGAGKDCTALFNKYHAWVNIDGLLTKCLVGVLADDSAPPIEEEDEKEDEEDDEDEEEQKEKEASSAQQGREDALRRLQESGDDHDDSSLSSSTSTSTSTSISMPPPHSRSSVIRINPGLQNLAAGGTVHDATAGSSSADTDTSSGNT